MERIVSHEVSFRVTITGRDLINYLNELGLGIDRDAQVTFEVPRGGDYSGMSVDVDGENPIVISWKGRK